MKSRNKVRAGLLAAAIVAVVGLAALAETVYVTARSARVVEKPDSFGKTLKHVVRGDKLERLERGEKWDKVKVDDKVGYVRTENLARKMPRQSGGGFGKFAAIVGGGDGSDTGHAAGTRALGDLGRKYTAEHDLEKGRIVVEETMDKMVLDLEKLEAFQREGKLGEFAGGEAGQ